MTMEQLSTLNYLNRAVYLIEKGAEISSVRYIQKRGENHEELDVNIRVIRYDTPEEIDARKQSEKASQQVFDAISKRQKKKWKVKK